MISEQSQDLPPYPVGLRLAGRRVVVVGGGAVAQRRVSGLLACGADVFVVSPVVTPALEGMITAGEVGYRQSTFSESDLDEAWYVLAVTNDPAVNAAVLAAAESRRIFCVRADDARTASAWTPAVGRHAGVTVAVLANREPRRSASIRDELISYLSHGELDGSALAPAEQEPGTVVLIGGGPGEPDLCTVAARRALAGADVVVADRLAPRELLDQLSEDVELIDVTKLPRGRAASQEEINRVLIERAREGLRVVRFKGGDNYVFGRGFEEVLACAEAGVATRVIPGVTSAISVPALAGIPVTHRGVAHEFTVISGHLPPDHPESLVNWPSVAGLHGTVVLLMAVQNFPAIAQALRDHGRADQTPVAIICDGSMPTMRTVLTTLAEAEASMQAEQIGAPAIIVVGPVVALAHPDAFDV